MNKTIVWKKCLTVGIICLLTLVATPTIAGNDIESPTEVTPTINGDVGLVISAGSFGRDFGIDIAFEEWNNKDESVTFFYNLSIDYLFFNILDTTLSWNHILEPHEVAYGSMSLLLGIKLISITGEVDDIKVTREGISFGCFVILFK